MIIDYRIYLTIFTLAYALQFLCFLLAGNQKWWGRIMTLSLGGMMLPAFVAFLDWLWS